MDQTPGNPLKGCFRERAPTPTRAGPSRRGQSRNSPSGQWKQVLDAWFCRASLGTWKGGGTNNYNYARAQANGRHNGGDE
eukprot:scaffold73243_cov31-Tisochrysis_lutea.AAC.2